VGAREYCLKFFLVLALTILAATIILQDIVTEYAGWVFWLWSATVADIVLQKPISSIFSKGKQ